MRFFFLSCFFESVLLVCMYVGRRKDEVCRYSYGKDLELRGGRVGEPGRGWGKGELGSGGLVW